MAVLLRPLTVLLISALPVLAAGHQRPRPGSADPVPVPYTAAESVAATRAVRRAILARDPGQAALGLRIAEFRAAADGYFVTLVPARPSVGGGGRAVVTRSRRVRDLVMFR